MVSTGYSDLGEEWAQKLAFRSDLITRDLTIEVLLYDDSVDQLSDTSDVGAITTEPTTGNYTRQTVDVDSADVSLSTSGGDLRAQATVAFDVDGTTETVDASAAVVSFESNVVNAETSQNPHHIFSAPLDIGSQNLSNFRLVEVTPQLDLA